MRNAGQFEDRGLASKAADFLLARGIPNQLDEEGEGVWAVWVREDDQIEEAKALLAEFRENPEDPRVRSAGQTAQSIRAEKRREQRRYVGKHVDVRTTWAAGALRQPGFMTYGLMAFSIGATAIMYFYREWPIEKAFFIANPDNWGGRIGALWGLKEVANGQVWRLITPIFLHFGILHILFNMMWMNDLGGMVERNCGSWHLAFFTLAVAILSNFAQYVASGPMFGGMSGVVYGLLGYVWIRGRYDRGSGLFLHRETVIMMLIWLVLCYTGLIGHIANTAHTVGLISGMAWGFFTSGHHRILMRRWFGA